MKIKPFTDNLVFFDAEFSSLDANFGEIISLSMVKFSGEELYLELEFSGEYNDFVKEKVLPKLKGNKVSKEEAFKSIKEFLGDSKPYLISYVNQYDIIFLHKLLDKYEYVPYWLPIDFSTMLFSMGYDPEVLRNNDAKFLSDFEIDITKYKRHNALEDAKMLRDIYLKMFGK